MVPQPSISTLFPTRRSSDLFTTLREGMTQAELSANISAAYERLGAQGNAMIIFGKYTAFPHGSVAPQTLHEGDRKSTRLNSSHVSISYAVFCLKKKYKKLRK